MSQLCYGRHSVDYLHRVGLGEHVYSKPELMNKREGGKKGLALSEPESGVLMSPFLVMNSEPSLHQKASFPELAIWKSGSSELEPTGASQRRISSVSSLSFVLMWCH